MIYSFKQHNLDIGHVLILREAPNPTPASMNWTVLLFGILVTFAILWYHLKAKQEYDGPVEYVKKEVL